MAVQTKGVVEARDLPKNVEAEQIVLGSVLLEPQTAGIVVGKLKPGDFYRNTHRVIFRTIRELVERGDPADIVAVANRLEEKEEMENAGGRLYLNELLDRVTTTASLDYYAEIVRKKATLRSLIEAGGWIAELGYGEAKEVEAQLARAQKIVASLSENGSSGSAGSSAAPLSREGLAALLDQVLGFIRKYVWLNTPQVVAVSLWVVHSHVFGAADATPYLHIHSAEKRSGKSRLLEVLSLLVARPWFTGHTTPAALVRKIDAEKPTLLLDESDAAFKGDKEYSETLRGLLNTGWRRGGKATVCIKKGGEWTTQDFSTFCPKAIAGIGKLPDTVEDRAIPIEMRRRKAGESVASFRWREAKDAASHLRGELAASCATSLPNLIGARPAIPTELDDRAAEVWEPLLAIADAAGGEWPARARTAALALSAGRALDDESIGVRLLADIRAAFSDKGTGRLASVSLTEVLCAMEESPWGDWRGHPLDPRGLAKLLRPYDVKPKTMRLDGGTVKGYEAADFADAWSRYLDAPSAGTTDTRDGPSVTRNRSVTKGCDQDSLVTDVTLVTDVQRYRRAREAEVEVVSPPLIPPVAVTAVTAVTTRTGTRLHDQGLSVTRGDVSVAESATEGDALRSRLVDLGTELSWPRGVSIRPGETIVEGEEGWRTFAGTASVERLASAVASAEAMKAEGRRR